MLKTILKALYWFMQRLARWLVGTRLDTWRWKFMVSGDEYARFSPSHNHPHRSWFAHKVMAIKPKPATILEFGCGPGDNLTALRDAGFAGSYIGLDVNAKVIDNAKAQFADDAAARFSVSTNDTLTQMAENSVDLIMTDAVLLYIGPDQIADVIGQMLRVSRSGLCLIEMHDPSASGAGSYSRDGFLRNYQHLAAPLDASVRLQKLPTDIWPTGRWPQFGHLIKITAS